MYTLLRVRLITGKSHQIRAHLAFVGLPILGDPKYGNQTINQRLGLKRQLLHAFAVVYDGKRFETPLPDWHHKFDWKPM